MQRKNYFLIPLKPAVGNIFYKKMFTLRRNSFRATLARSGMAMIMALSVIVILSTIMALSLSMTSETSKRTTDIYLYEQAVLYSKSAAELALLDIAQNGCQDTFNQNFDGIYDANVTMRYVYTNNTIPATCTNIYTTTTAVTTPEQNGSVLMDITVTTNAGTEPIRYFRRSIQKL